MDRARRTRAVRIAALVDLAFTYWEDGAWLTAAARLEEAAKLLREGHAEFQAALEESVK